MLSPKKVDPTRLPTVIQEKWGVDILDEGFVPVPKRLVRSLKKIFVGINGLDYLAIILAVADYRRPGAYRPPTSEYLAVVAGLKKSEFEIRLKELEDRQWVKVQQSVDGLDISIDGAIRRILEETGSPD